jgi:hypothetical protein
MDLKKFLPGQDSEKISDYYWALIIEPGWVQAGIWRVRQNRAQVIFSGEPIPWEEESDLINATDSVLSAAVQDFPENEEEPTKTVFGVVSSWVSGGQIKEEYLNIIKKICSELSLKPAGFVVLSEAIAHYYKAEEGSPLNAIVLGIYKDEIEVSVFNLGNLLGNTSVARSVSIADDVAEGITRFGGNDVLPSRFILYDGKDAELEDDQQSLINVNWEEISKLKFLHTPKIEIVNSERKVYTVSLAGASELGEITEVKGMPEKEQESSKFVPVVEEKEVVEKVEEETAIPEKFGFTVDQDLEEENQPLAESTEKPETFYTPEDNLNVSEGAVNNVEPVKKRPPVALHNTLEKIRSVKKGISNFSPKVSLPHVRFAVNRMLVIGIFFFLLILIGGGVAWWYLPKASVVVYIAPRQLEQLVDISVDPKSSSSDLERKVIPGEEVTTTLTGDKTKSATGTKLIGDKAKGEVTIYRVGTQLSLPANTQLIGPGNLRFTLDEAVTVASGSAGSAGTIKAKVTADDIGTQYNLAGGGSFRVGNYATSDMEAKNETAMSGGTSQEIRVISSDDQKELLRDLQKELEEKAATELQQQQDSNKLFIKDSLTTSDAVKVYSGKVGDESTTVKLTLTLKANAFTVDRQEMISLARNVLKDQMPNGYVLRDEEINVSFTYKGKNNDQYLFTSYISASLLPEIDNQMVAERIAGKYVEIAREYLRKEVPGYSKAIIKINPVLPGRLGTLPRVSKNIDVEVQAEQ